MPKRIGTVPAERANGQMYTLAVDYSHEDCEPLVHLVSSDAGTFAHMPPARARVLAAALLEAARVADREAAAKKRERRARRG
jgi:hypothetical protein